jgi:glycosyltransferase involved in cell wall biosynthesis
LKPIYFTVTNDLTFDQRMHRICSSLQSAGFPVVLVGRELNSSLPLSNQNFLQKRLPCFFTRGFLFYAEYNLRLFFFLLFQPMAGICAIDLDTIFPAYLVSRLRDVSRVYDAHEFFTEMVEVRSRPQIQDFWRRLERFTVPRFKYGYTVSEGLAREYNRLYQRNFIVIRNLPKTKTLDHLPKNEKFILAQGAVNKGRAFEYLIPAMKQVPCKLVVCGDGNYMDELRQLIRENGVEEKVELRGMLPPDDLWKITQSATIGIGIADPQGTHQYLALPNKFLDYIQAGLPQITMAYPEYEKINDEFRVAVLLPELSVDGVARAINELLVDDDRLDDLHRNCLEARKYLCWEAEEDKLIRYYREIFRNE